MAIRKQRAALIFVLAGMLCIIGSGCFSESHYAKVAHERLESLAPERPPVQWVLSVTNLPAAVQQSLGGIADVGRPFSSDCGGSAPHTRFLCATKFGTTYNVAWEYGGRVYGWKADQYVLDAQGNIVGITKIELEEKPLALKPQ